MEYHRLLMIELPPLPLPLLFRDHLVKKNKDYFLCWKFLSFFEIQKEETNLRNERRDHWSFLRSFWSWEICATIISNGASLFVEESGEKLERKRRKKRNWRGKRKWKWKWKQKKNLGKFSEDKICRFIRMAISSLLSWESKWEKGFFSGSGKANKGI